MSLRQAHHYLSWVEVDLKAIRNNYQQIRKMVQERQVELLPYPAKGRKAARFPEVLTVIKADAYGHGMIQVAQMLNRMSVEFFGVSDIPEGILLRKNGIKKKILLLETSLPSQVKDIVDYNLIPTVCTLSLASSLNTYAKKIGRPVDVHIKVDTGMGRLGVWHRGAEGFIKDVMRLKNLSVKGLYTHFPLADSNPDYTVTQVTQMHELVKTLDRQGLVVPYVHAANSAGLIDYQAVIFNLVRPGIMLYGLYPDIRLAQKVKLQPAMSVKTRIIFIKTVLKGQGISYGHTFVAPCDLVAAVLPIGYSDGYFRSLSNKSSVLVNGQRCPLLGRVTMDQIVVDVSRVPGVKIGQMAVILGKQKQEEIAADELAGYAGTINYEILCSLGSRLPRVYKS
jgi:alanine racemase